MSLINKMLQDLDARGSQPGEPLETNVKSVTRVERRVPPGLVVGAVALTLAVIAGSVAGWRYLKRVPPVPAPVTRAVTVIVPPAAVAVPASQPVAVAAPAAPPPSEPVGRKSEGLGVPRTSPEPASRPLLERAPAPVPKRPRAAARAKPVREPTPARVETQPSPASGRQMTIQQRAESQYHGALSSLQEGRNSEATAALEQALQLDPHHEAARQTLVGLLVEAHRPDEAIRQLQLGLTLDPRQPALAMLLARLQIERGGNGIDTLTRTLPYAAGNGEYHAFLAGALQRAQRHREAAQQYQAALRSAPQNGVWLMGMGISLLAEQRNAEAADALQKAKASGTLSPELQAFVERKLQQASH